MPLLEEALNDMSPSDLVIAVGFQTNERLFSYQKSTKGPPVPPAVQGPNDRQRSLCTDNGCAAVNSTISLTTKMYKCNLMTIKGVIPKFETSQSSTGEMHYANNIFIKCTADGSGALNHSSSDLETDRVHDASWQFWGFHSGIITRNDLAGLSYMPFQQSHYLFSSPLSSRSPLHGIDQFVCDGTFFDKDGPVTPTPEIHCQFAFFDADS